MNLHPHTRHLLAKDWRCSWPLAAALGGAIFFKAVILLLFYRTRHGHAEVDAYVQLTVLGAFTKASSELMFAPALLLAYADQLLLAGLVLLLVHEDPPAGTQAFWRSRPIAGQWLAWEKLLLIVLAAWPLQLLALLAAICLGGLSLANGPEMLLWQACESAAWAGWGMLVGTCIRKPWSAFAGVVALRVMMPIIAGSVAAVLSYGDDSARMEMWNRWANLVLSWVVFTLGACILFWAYRWLPLTSGRFQIAEKE